MTGLVSVAISMAVMVGAPALCCPPTRRRSRGYPDRRQFKYSFARFTDLPDAELHLLDTGHFALEGKLARK